MADRQVVSRELAVELHCCYRPRELRARIETLPAPACLLQQRIVRPSYTYSKRLARVRTA